MFGFGIQELLVILAIVLLIFGPKRLKNIGSDLGNAIKGFRTAVADEDKPAWRTPAPEAAKVIDGDNVPNDAGTQKAAEQETSKDRILRAVSFRHPKTLRAWRIQTPYV